MTDWFDQHDLPQGDSTGLPRDRDALRAHLSSLRRSVSDAPDFTGAVLREVDKRRPWLDSRERWLVWVGRVSAAAAAVVIAGGIYVLQRETDVEGLVSAPAERPIDGLVQSVSADSQRVDVRVFEGVTIGRAVLAQPLASVLRTSEPSRRTASVWDLQRLAMDDSAAEYGVGADEVVLMAGFASAQPSVMAPMFSRELLAPGASPDGDFSASLVVPAAFQPAASRLGSKLRGD